MNDMIAFRCAPMKDYVWANIKYGPHGTKEMRETLCTKGMSPSQANSYIKAQRKAIREGYNR